MIRPMFLLLLGLVFSGCASVRSVSVTQIPAERARMVEAQVSKFIFLAFNFNNDYLDELTGQLKDQCPKGRVEGILTKHESYSYVIAHKVIVTARGFCNASNKV